MRRKIGVVRCAAQPPALALPPDGQRRRWLALPAVLLPAHPTPAAPLQGPGTVSALPAARTEGALSLEQVLWRRRSVRRFGPVGLGLAQVGQLLWAAQGFSTLAGRRATPSAGALYPLTLFLVAGDVASLPAGAYRYQAERHGLLAWRDGDLRSIVADAALAQRWVQQAPALVVLAADPEPTTARYGARAERFIALESGACAQNLLLQAVALGLGATLVSAFDEAALRRCLALPATLQPMAVLPVGRPG